MAGDKKEAAKETANPNSGSSRGLELSVFLIFVRVGRVRERK